MASPIEFKCTSCGGGLRAGMGLAGKTVACPKCKQPVLVPAPDLQPEFPPPAVPTPEMAEGQPKPEAAISINTLDGKLMKVEAPKKLRARPATDRQKEFARDLGIQFDEGITAREISAMIDAALDREESMEREEIEPHLKTLRQCEEGDMLDELKKRGSHAFIVSWPIEDESSTTTNWELKGAEGVTLEFIRFALVQLIVLQAKQESVSFDDPMAFFNFLARCAGKPER